MNKTKIFMGVKQMCIIVETCPNCGHDLRDLVIATYPPILKKECWNCGWCWTGKQEKVIRIPFGGNTTNTTNIVEAPSLNDYLNDPNNFRTEASLVNNFEQPACINCSNNPKNGGNGICSCTLGQINIT